ncbi:MAG: penicillin acylase family protein [Conexivisphaerales archaeon]
MRPVSFAALVIIIIAIAYFSEGVQLLNPVNGAWVVINGSSLKSGSFSIPGLESNVTITIDSSGMAHIRASNDHDLFFAQGFYSAYQRLDQMEFQAILASGNLSRYIGNAGLASDKTMLLLGLSRNAYLLENNLSRLYPSFYSLVQDFSDGVNAYIHSPYYVTPLVFKLAGIKPFDWSPFYSLVWQEYMSWSLTTGASEPLAYSLLYSSLGANMSQLLWPYYPYYTQNVTVIPGDGEVNNFSLSKQGIDPAYLWSLDWVQPWATGINTSLLPQITPLIRYALSNISDPYLEYFASSFVGSNSWVVTSKFSSTSSPMLANDPHLPLYAPSLWLPMQLVDNNFNVTGWELVGEPGILIGHTQHTAWGLTTPEGNSANVYLEVLNGSSYLYDGSWHPMQTITYRLTNGNFTVYYTNNGPLLARYTAGGKEYGISLNWVAARGDSYDLLAEIKLDNSTNYQDMLNALKYWGSPPQNFALVSDQHAGYITAGYYPVINETLPDGKRVQVIGSRSLLNGSVSRYEPAGLVPFNYLPQAVDVGRGFMFAPNQPTVWQNYPYPFIGGFWASGGRAQTIYNYMSSKQSFSIQQMMDLQSNITDYWSVQLSKLFLNSLQGIDMTPLQAQAYSYLSSWNHQASTDSVGMTVYWYTLAELDNLTYGRLYQQYNLSMLPEPFTSTTIYLAINYPDASIFGGSFQNAVRNAFYSAVSLLERNLGGNVSEWQWGKVHMLEIQSYSNLAELSLGPYPIWGDSHTVSVGGVPEQLTVPEPYVRVGSSLRFIASPLSQQFFGIIPGGASGNVLSSFYSNQLQRWISHEYYNMNNQTTIVRWELR